MYDTSIFKMGACGVKNVLLPLPDFSHLLNYLPNWVGLPERCAAWDIFLVVHVLLSSKTAFSRQFWISCLSKEKTLFCHFTTWLPFLIFTRKTANCFYNQKPSSSKKLVSFVCAKWCFCWLDLFKNTAEGFFVYTGET